MQWTKPDFQEITLSGEVTAYVNTDETVLTPADVSMPVEPATAAGDPPPRMNMSEA